METITNINAAVRTKNFATKSNPIVAFFNKQAAQFEASRFAAMTILITAQSCLGSIACQLLLENNAGIIPLALCASVTMAANAMMIAQASGKWCVASLYISVLANLAIIFASVA